ncbi:DUF3293 domain-containing protein [Rhodanobacter ginsengisoli]|uniref:DUF3293 domain-containing protein n=1 Tax=Rhodanobacter ginsengisoli TaxID=418646 RepID=A0ABW0QNN2_9GAMM
MDEFLLEAFRATAYYVSLDTVTWATIRVDLPLPRELVSVVGARPWGFITAWNPQARRRPAAENLAAQHELLSALKNRPDVDVYAALGVGTSGWAEPSLFAIGADVAVLDRLSRDHAQLAYVHGHADGIALLRLLE